MTKYAIVTGVFGSGDVLSLIQDDLVNRGFPIKNSDKHNPVNTERKQPQLTIPSLGLSHKLFRGELTRNSTVRSLGASDYDLQGKPTRSLTTRDLGIQDSEFWREDLSSKESEFPFEPEKEHTDEYIHPGELTLLHKDEFHRKRRKAVLKSNKRIISLGNMLGPYGHSTTMLQRLRFDMGMNYDDMVPGESEWAVFNALQQYGTKGAFDMSFAQDVAELFFSDPNQMNRESIEDMVGIGPVKRKIRNNFSFSFGSTEGTAVNYVHSKKAATMVFKRSQEYLSFVASTYTDGVFYRSGEKRYSGKTLQTNGTPKGIFGFGEKQQILVPVPQAHPAYSTGSDGNVRYCIYDSDKRSIEFVHLPFSKKEEPTQLEFKTLEPEVRREQIQHIFYVALAQTFLRAKPKK
jgi:hypothetical protein